MPLDFYGPVRLTPYPICSAYFSAGNSVFSFTTFQLEQCFSAKIQQAERDLCPTANEGGDKKSSDKIVFLSEKAKF